MKTYLVGGAVRDALLGKAVKERDWVVVGASSAQMLAQGFKQVGRDFPVFLHPKTQEEYALARTERKSGQGYSGFEVHADPEVTLEQDLLRRDLTINAIAKSSDGSLIDPYGGVEDVKNKILKHVSEAFVEDPLRVVRLARFFAKLPGFRIDEETRSLTCQMAESGELASLTPERVWQEWVKVLECAEPWRFVEALQDLGAWSRLMPLHTDYQADIAALQAAKKNGYQGGDLFSVLGLYIATEDWKHSVSRLTLPKAVMELALLITAMRKEAVLQAGNTSWDAARVLECLYNWDAFRRTERWAKAVHLLSCVLEQTEAVRYLDCMRQAGEQAVAVDLKPALAQIQGKQVGEAIKRLRFDAVEKTLTRW